MTAATRANPYTPISTWMKDYGLTNFAWDSCKHYPRQTTYSPTHEPPDTIPNPYNPVHILHRHTDILKQTGTWHAVAPRLDSASDRHMAIGDFALTLPLDHQPHLQPKYRRQKTYKPF